jgi:hypothetical protein
MTEPQASPPAPEGAARRRANPIYWVLIVPIVIPLITPLFNAEKPRLLGFPMFYWLQLAFIVLSVASTVLVYVVTKKR